LGKIKVRFDQGKQLILIPKIKEDETVSAHSAWVTVTIIRSGTISYIFRAGAVNSEENYLHAVQIFGCRFVSALSRSVAPF
jgi:hypothetical protein